MHNIENYVKQLEAENEVLRRKSECLSTIIDKVIRGQYLCQKKIDDNGKPYYQLSMTQSAESFIALHEPEYLLFKENGITVSEYVNEDVEKLWVDIMRASVPPDPLNNTP